MVRVRIGGLVVMGTVRVRDWTDGFFFSAKVLKKMEVQMCVFLSVSQLTPSRCHQVETMGLS